MRSFFRLLPSSPESPSRPGPTPRGPSRTASWQPDAGVADAATRRTSVWSSPGHSQEPSTHGVKHAVLQSFRQPTVDVFPIGVQLGCPLWPRLGPDGFRRVQIPAHRVLGDAPGLQQCLGWSGPFLSSRRSLSLVPPSTKFRRHLHEIFVNNALAIGGSTQLRRFRSFLHRR